MLIPPLEDFGDDGANAAAAAGGGVVEIVGSADEDDVGVDLSYDILAYPLLEIVILVGVIVAVSPSPLINVKPDDLVVVVVVVVVDFFVLLVSIQLDLLYEVFAYPLLLLAPLVSPPLFDT